MQDPRKHKDRGRFLYTQAACECKIVLSENLINAEAAV